MQVAPERFRSERRDAGWLRDRRAPPDDSEAAKKALDRNMALYQTRKAPSAPALSLQILDGVIRHDVRQEVNGFGQRLFRFFESDYATGYGQQRRSCR
ncbi:MAG TPA: hypothetical protein GX399_01170 [Xanthomonadaceae bacterium]|nr:hypothetical protein [Xanthomonadaceae bacterium]